MKDQFINAIDDMIADACNSNTPQKQASTLTLEAFERILKNLLPPMPEPKVRLIGSWHAERGKLFTWKVPESCFQSMYKYNWNHDYRGKIVPVIVCHKLDQESVRLQLIQCGLTVVEMTKPYEIPTEENGNESKSG